MEDVRDHAREWEERFADVRKVDHRMWQIFESSVAGFYGVEQNRFRVATHRRIEWPVPAATAEADLRRIPSMEADLILEPNDRRIILDTKFYQKSFGGRVGGKLHSSNLYQLLSYLRNRQGALPGEPRYEGILLYPHCPRSPCESTWN